MSAGNEQDMLLGRQTPVVDDYAPHLLYPIPRDPARALIGCDLAVPLHGSDLWHAYEMSWLDAQGRPLARVGRFTVAADSPHMVESKSFKLYLNSLNNTPFDSEEEAAAIICRDVSAVAGSDIGLELLAVDDASLAGANLPGRCLDELGVAVPYDEPGADMLKVLPGQQREEQLYTHLLRSLCPVTGQPDWASLWIHYRGSAMEHASLLRYILAFRRHQGFHEQCVERMFCDIYRRLRPDFLHLQAFYTRRGGLDINPFRSTDPDARPLPRLNRQ